MIDGDALGRVIGDAFDEMTDAILAMPPLVPKEEQAAFWERVQEMVARAGLTYERGDVRQQVTFSGGTSEAAYTLLVQTAEGTHVARGQNVDAIFKALGRALGLG